MWIDDVAFSVACGSWAFLWMGPSVLDNFWGCVTMSPWHWVCKWLIPYHRHHAPPSPSPHSLSTRFLFPFSANAWPGSYLAPADGSVSRPFQIDLLFQCLKTLQACVSVPVLCCVCWFWIMVSCFLCTWSSSLCCSPGPRPEDLCFLLPDAKRVQNHCILNSQLEVP